MDIEQIRRKITALENKNRVSIANSSIEAKCLKNEGSVLKASSGVITSNVVLKAPNIPDDLQQKIQKIDQFDKSLDELENKVSKNTTDIANHTHSDLSDAITKLEKALEGKLPSSDIEAVLKVIKEIQFIMTSTTSSWTLLHHVEEIQDEIMAKFDEWTTKINQLDDKVDRTISFFKSISLDTSKVNTLLFGPLTKPLRFKGGWYHLVRTSDIGRGERYILDIDYIHTTQQIKVSFEPRFGEDMSPFVTEVFKIKQYENQPYLQMVNFINTTSNSVNTNNMDCSGVGNCEAAQFNFITCDSSAITDYNNSSHTILLSKTNTTDTRLISLEQKDKAHDTSISTLEGKVSTAEGNISTLQGTVSSQGTSISTLEGTVSSHTSSISTIESTNSEQNDRLTALESDMESVSKKVTSNTNKYLTQAYTLEQFGSRVTACEKKVTACENTVSNQILTILGMIYPVGSIYTSMNSSLPEAIANLGTWTQITNRFLYCTNTSKTTGGSAYISVDQLPAHSHSINWGYGSGSKGDGWVRADGNNPANQWGGTQSTGSGKAYYPPYMTCYAWYRTA